MEYSSRCVDDGVVVVEGGIDDLLEGALDQSTVLLLQICFCYLLQYAVGGPLLHAKRASREPDHQGPARRAQFEFAQDSGKHNTWPLSTACDILIFLPWPLN